MFLYKNAAAALLISFSLVLADKKIELQDIEEDNLKSENTKENETEDYKTRPTIVVTGSAGSARGADLNQLDYLKNGFLRLYETPVQIQQPRYVQQYAVTENQERTSGDPETTVQKPEYSTPGASPSMLGYLSNVPMQILYIPQYYSEPPQQAVNTHAGIQYVAPINKMNIAHFQHDVQPQEQHQNYVEVPAYITPSGKAFTAPVPQYAQPITYVTYGPPTVTSSNHATTVMSAGTQDTSQYSPSGSALYTSASGSSYAVPLVYQQSMTSPPLYRSYYSSVPQYETNSVDDGHNSEPETQKEFPPTERPHTKPVGESVRYYTSRVPLKGERGQPSQISELPHPSPLLYGSQPAHLAGTPKILPYYRPITKPVYSHISGNLIPGFPQKPRDGFSYLPKKRPTSLLDSYVPSSVQLEYMKRGLGRDPLTTYETLSGMGNRYSFSSGSHPQPRQLERGFLPNQMYHTASGGVTYGHYKRTPPTDKKVQHN